jgi:hypothetical protein
MIDMVDDGEGNFTFSWGQRIQAAADNPQDPIEAAWKWT